jgi:hypothetical protein
VLWAALFTGYQSDGLGCWQLRKILRVKCWHGIKISRKSLKDADRQQ